MKKFAPNFIFYMIEMENRNVLYNILPNLVDTGIKQDAYNSLVNINEKIIDELYIILNDFKREFFKDVTLDPMHLYDRNEIRANIVRSVNTYNISEQFVGEDSKLITYCVVFNNMVERIEKIMSDNDLFTDSLYKLFGLSNKIINVSIEYTDEHTIKLDIGSRDTVLIIIMLCVYIFHNVEDFLLNFGEYVCNINNLHDFREYLDTIYKPFHSMIHKCNTDYNKDNVFNQFLLIQTYLFIKSLVLISKFNGSNKFINCKLLQNSCERDCSISKDSSAIVFPNVILCSIYLWNQKYSWFKMDLFQTFLNKYGNTIKTLGCYVLSREKFNVLYGFGVLYGLRFMSLSDVNESQSENVIMNSNDINDKLMLEHNGAISITIKDENKTMKRKNLIIELQTGYPIGNNEISSNVQAIHSYIIFDVYAEIDFNIYGICYAEKDLINVINSLGKGKEVGYIEYAEQYDNTYLTGGDGTFDDMLKIKIKNNISIYLMYIIIVLLIIVICSVTFYVKQDNTIAKPSITTFDKSLL